MGQKHRVKELKLKRKAREKRAKKRLHAEIAVKSKSRKTKAAGGDAE